VPAGTPVLVAASVATAVVLVSPRTAVA
jgi:hypothetical protein